MKHYIPEKGDIVWLDFDPQLGREQGGKRPAVVLSPHVYNAKVGLAVFCPITTKIKQFPFEVLLQNGLKTKGVVLADQIKNFDWRTRSIRFREKLPQKNLNEVLNKLQLLLY